MVEIQSGGCRLSSDLLTKAFGEYLQDIIPAVDTPHEHFFSAIELEDEALVMTNELQPLIMSCGKEVTG